MNQRDKTYRISITSSVAGTIRTDPSYLGKFLSEVRQGLSAEAEIEAPFRKPLRSDPQAPWIYCFGKQAVLYQIEADSEVKIFLVMSKNEGEFLFEADVDKAIVGVQKNWSVISQLCDKPISMSFEEVESRWLWGASQTERSKARLELAIEGGEKAVALLHSNYFSSVIFELRDGSRHICENRLFQDYESCWWCIVCPINESIVPRTYLQIMILQMQLYEKLKEAPPFRYAFAAVGGQDFLSDVDSLNATTYKKVATGKIPSIGFLEGIVLSESIRPNVRRSVAKHFQPFRDGYVWLLLSQRMLTARQKDPILHTDPRSAQEYYNNGLVLSARGQRKDALKAFEAALLLKPDFSEAELVRNNIIRTAAFEAALLLKPDFSEAELVRDNTLHAADSETAHILSSRAVVLVQQQRYTEAIATIEKAQELDPTSPVVHQNKATCLFTLGRYSEAVKHCDIALKLNPSHHLSVVAYQLKGDCLFNQGYLEDALVSHQRSIDLKPGDGYNLHPHCQKASILCKLSRFQEAMVACEAALELSPKNQMLNDLKLAILASLDKE